MTSIFSVAVHALVFLNHKKTSVSSEALAENICTNPARVRKVMAMLKRTGLVETKEGNLGGYSFVGDAKKVSLSEIAKTTDTRFVEAGWRSGDEDMDCQIASGIANVMDSIYTDLNEKCMEHLKHISIADVEHKIFKGSDKG